MLRNTRTWARDCGYLESMVDAYNGDKLYRRVVYKIRKSKDTIII